MADDKKVVEVESVSDTDVVSPKKAGALSPEDKAALDMAKLNRKLAVANAEKALAENQVAELTFKNLVLQLYMKYGLSEVDGIDEQGNLLRSKE